MKRDQLAQVILAQLSGLTEEDFQFHRNGDRVLISRGETEVCVSYNRHSGFSVGKDGTKPVPIMLDLDPETAIPLSAVAVVFEAARKLLDS